MVGIWTKGSELEQEKEVYFDNHESLKQAYHELLSNSSILLKPNKCLRKDFKKLSKDHIDLKKKHEAKVNCSLKENIEVCDVYENLEIKRTKLYLENEKISEDKVVLLQNFLDLENQLSVLQKDLKEIIELNDNLKEDRYDLWRDNAHIQRDYKDLEKSKHNLWIEC